jgi:epoxyqueuosine reductase
VIVLGANYAPSQAPETTLAQPTVGTISVYARGSDYHDVLKKRVKQLARLVVERYGGEVKLFVDTAPVMEKPLAQAAGIGWQGKHTNLVSRSFGSWLFLAELFTTLELPADQPEADHCGACRACLDACPTRAFPAPHQLDARRCISYLTIEHKGHIAPEFRRAIGNRIYGCDDCLAVCPWNKFAKAASETRFASRPGLDAPSLATLAALDDDGFRQAFSDSPIKRVGRARFVRNVLIALGNSGDDGSAEAALARLGDESALVRAMAVWALFRLVSPARFAALRARYLGDEPDAAVCAEWAARPELTPF